MLQRHALIFSLSLAALLAPACTATERCGVPGVTATCPCRAGTLGARVCTDDKTWAECDCSGAIALPNPIVGGSGGDMGGMGGVSGGTGGTGGRAGTGGMSGGSGGIGGGGVGGTDEDDGGGPMMSDAGDTDAGPSNPYGPCMADADCGPDAACVITPSFPTNASVCAPKCIDVGDCPVPPGSYQAVLECVTGYCKLNCTPVLFQPLLTCPTGMTCIAPLGAAYCHDDGI